MERGSPDDAVNLRLDYSETLAVWRHLVDVRFKLLALVPTLSAAGVGIFGSRKPSYGAVVTAAVSIVAITAVAIYDLRNSMFHDTAIHRAKTLEQRLGFERSSRDLDSETLDVTDPPRREGGFFTDRPRGKLKLFGLLPVWHDVALWLVYSVSVAGWVAVGVYVFTARRHWTTPFNSAWSYAVVGGVTAGVVWLAGLVLFSRRWGALLQDGLLPPGGPAAHDVPQPDS